MNQKVNFLRPYHFPARAPLSVGQMVWILLGFSLALALYSRDAWQNSQSLENQWQPLAQRLGGLESPPSPPSPSGLLSDADATTEKIESSMVKIQQRLRLKESLLAWDMPSARRPSGPFSDALQKIAEARPAHLWLTRVVLAGPNQPWTLHGQGLKDQPDQLSRYLSTLAREAFPQRYPFALQRMTYLQPDDPKGQNNSPREESTAANGPGKKSEPALFSFQLRAEPREENRKEANGRENGS